jgi:hypothetical protein
MYTLELFSQQDELAGGRETDSEFIMLIVFVVEKNLDL